MATPDTTGRRDSARRRKHRRPAASAATLEREIALDAQRRHDTPSGGRACLPPVDHPPDAWRDSRDRRGWRKPEHVTSDARRGKPPGNRGKRYPRNPPTVSESVRWLRACEDTVHGRRRRALYIVLWRTGMRINEALHLLPSDIDLPAGSITIRHGKGTKGSGPRTRVIGMDPWGWQQLSPWLDERGLYPPGPLFPVLTGPTAGTHAWQYACVDQEFKRTALKAGIDKRTACHQLRHAFAQERKREGESLEVIQQQLGHAHMWITMRYLGQFTTEEVLDAARVRPVPMMTVSDAMALADLAPTTGLGWGQ